MTQTNHSELAAVRHILSAPSIDRRCAPYISDREIRWPEVFAEAETMSGGERVLVQVARDLWAGETTVGVADLTGRLSPASFSRVVEAMAIARGAEPHAVAA